MQCRTLKINKVLLKQPNVSAIWTLSFLMSLPAMSLWESRKVGTGEHPSGENSMTMSGLSCKKALGWPFLSSFDRVGLRNGLLALVGPSFLTMKFYSHSVWVVICWDYWNRNKWVSLESNLHRMAVKARAMSGTWKMEYSKRSTGLEWPPENRVW